MTYEEIYSLRNSCITEEELEDIKSSSCYYRVEKIGSSPYEPKDFYKIKMKDRENFSILFLIPPNIIRQSRKTHPF